MPSYRAKIKGLYATREITIPTARNLEDAKEQVRGQLNSGERIEWIGRIPFARIAKKRR